MFFLESDKTYLKLPPNGFFTNEESIAKDLAFRPPSNQHYETTVINWCRDNFIRDNKAFVDIGGHIGSWTWGCADKAHHTYTFECNKPVYNCLCANIFLKGLSYKVDTFNCGLSNESGTKTYYRRSVDGGGNGITYLRESDHAVPTDIVDVKKLDDFGLENINFLKIDVEGHEKQVLEGAVNTLSDNHHPTFIFESWDAWRETEDHACPAVDLWSKLFEYITETLEYKIVPVANWTEMFIAERQGV